MCFFESAVYAAFWKTCLPRSPVRSHLLSQVWTSFDAAFWTTECGSLDAAVVTLHRSAFRSAFESAVWATFDAAFDAAQWRAEQSTELSTLE